jgi:hypothetical protein
MKHNLLPNIVAILTLVLLSTLVYRALSSFIMHGG